MECPVCGQKHFTYNDARKCCDTKFDLYSPEEIELLKKIKKTKSI